MNILIAEDQTLLRDTLRNYLLKEKEFQSIKSVANGRQAVDFVEKNNVDLIVMDIKMPVMDGLTASRKIKKRFPGIGILILTLFENEQDCLESIEAGCDGYLLKDVEPETLTTALKLISTGITVFRKNILSKAIQRAVPLGSTKLPGLDVSFSENELAVIGKICEGKQNKVIASELECSLAAVKNRIASILAKTNLSDRTQIVIYAIRQGILM